MTHKEFMLNLFGCTEEELNSALGKYVTVVEAVQKTRTVSEHFIKDIVCDMRKNLLIRKIALYSMFECFLPRIITYNDMFGNPDECKFFGRNIYDVMEELPSDIKSFAEHLLLATIESDSFQAALHQKFPYTGKYEDRHSRTLEENYRLSLPRLADYTLLAYLDFLSHDPNHDFVKLSNLTANPNSEIGIRFVDEDNFLKGVKFGLKAHILNTFALGDKTQRYFNHIGWGNVSKWLKSGPEALEAFSSLLIRLPKETTFQEKDYRELAWICEALGEAGLHKTRRAFLAYWLQGLEINKVETFPNIWAGNQNEKQSNFRLCRELETLLNDEGKTNEAEALKRGMAAKELWWKEWIGGDDQYKETLLTLIDE